MRFTPYAPVFEALAYGRFTWKVPDDFVGDVERILTWYDGVSTITDDGRVLPVKVPLDLQEPFKAPYLAPVGGKRIDSGRYPWSRIIQVAPARSIIDTLRETCNELDDTQVKLTKLAKITRAYKSKDPTKGDALELVNGTYEGAMPAITVDGTMSQDDIINIGDGETHATSVNDMFITALSRACIALGVHMDAVIKGERVIVDEANRTLDLVEIVRWREISERYKLADFLGWERPTVNF
jgi:hypothetical protein